MKLKKNEHTTKRLLRNVKEETRTEEYKMRPQKNFLQKKKSTIIANWRASVASETLTGVTQSKIGDVCLFI